MVGTIKTKAKREAETEYREKRKKNISSPTPNWPELEPDLLEYTVKKLTFIDAARCKAVCSSWGRAAISYGACRTPWLMLPSDQDNDEDCRRFYSLQEHKVATIKNREFKYHCVGSSHGWLVTMPNVKTLNLFNPISGSKISVKISGKIKLDADIYPKVALSSNNIFSIAMIYPYVHHFKNRVQLSSKFEFYDHRVKKWIKLPELVKHREYCDIIFSNDQLFSLSMDGGVEAWDCRNSPPVKTMKNLQPCPGHDDPDLREYFESSLLSNKTYLVESAGDILYVVRCIGNWVNHEGVPIDEVYIQDDPNGICPYRTLEFHVWKMNFAANKWEKVECLGDRALFLGGNQSLSISARDVSGCQENSIYFTDDRWEEIECVGNNDDDEEYGYGGHDMGVFNLENKVVEEFVEFDSWRIDPLPFWFVPNPW